MNKHPEVASMRSSAQSLRRVFSSVGYTLANVAPELPEDLSREFLRAFESLHKAMIEIESITEKVANHAGFES